MREPTEHEVEVRAQALFTRFRQGYGLQARPLAEIHANAQRSWRERARTALRHEMNACRRACPKCEASPYVPGGPVYPAPLPPTPPTLADDLAALERELVNVKAERDIAVREAERARKERDAARQDLKIAESRLSSARKVRDRYVEELKEANRRIEILKQAALNYRTLGKQAPGCSRQELEADRDNWRETAIRRGEERDAALQDLKIAETGLTQANRSAEHWREDALKFADQAEARLRNNRRLDEQRKETVWRCETACSEARKDGYRQGISDASEAVHAVLRRDAWTARSWQQAKAARLLTSAISQRLRKLEQEAAK